MGQNLAEWLRILGDAGKRFLTNGLGNLCGSKIKSFISRDFSCKVSGNSLNEITIAGTIRERRE